MPNSPSESARRGGRTQKLLFAVLPVGFGVACALFFLASYRDAKGVAVTMLQEEQRIHARQAARGIESFFATWTSILTALSRMEAIVRLDASGRSNMRLFLEAHQEQIRGITRVDQRGVILASVPLGGVEGNDISGQRHVAEILRDHRPVVSDVFHAVQGFDAIALHVPVFDGATFRGTIAVVIDFQALARRYFEVIRIGETGHAWVLSRDGTLLYSPIPGLSGRPALESFRERPRVNAMIGDMMKGREGLATYPSERPDKRAIEPRREYAAYMPVRLGNTFWSVVVASGEEEILASLNSFRNRLALVVCLVFVGGTLLSAVAARAWLIVSEEGKRRRAEEALRENRQLLHSIVNGTPDAIYATDAQGRYLLVNAAAEKSLGRPAAEVLGKASLERDADREILETGATRTREETVTGAEGQKTLVTTKGPIRDAAGGVVGLFVISHDITERKRAEDELRTLHAELESRVRERTSALQEANRELESFSYSVSHDLRAPVRAIDGFGKLLEEHTAGQLDEEGRRLLGLVRKSSLRMGRLIDDLLTFSRAGRSELRHEEIDVARVVSEVLADVLPEGAPGQVAVRVGDLPRARGDRALVRQVILNLLQNAVKFSATRADPVVEVGSRRDGGTVEYFVRDNGVGFDQRYVGKLYGVFRRLHSEKEFPGTGIGLSLVRRIVERHGGRVRAEGVVGEGAAFYFTLGPDPAEPGTKAGTA